MLSSIKSAPDVLGDFCIVYLVVEALTPSSIDWSSSHPGDGDL